jgi:hypothetical protein
MVAAPTADELDDLRLDLADPGAVEFDDGRLTRLWTRAGGDYYGTLVLAGEQLLTAAVNQVDYAFGQQAVVTKASQRFDHLQERLVTWRALAGGTFAGQGTVQTGDLTYATFPATEHGD